MGGGGGNATVEVPDYIEYAHHGLLNRHTSDYPNQSWVSLFNQIVDSDSPYCNPPSFAAVDAAAASMTSAATDLETFFGYFMTGPEIDDLMDKITDDSRIVEAADAFDDSLTLKYENDIVPRFEAGMRDINAVMSSAFVIGKAVIEADRQREVARYASELRQRQLGDNAIQLITASLQWRTEVGRLLIETGRYKTVYESERYDKLLEYQVKDTLWGMDLFQSGANLIGAQTGAVVPPSNKPSKTQSALGGAMAGASVGATVGGGYGAAVGAVVGAVAGYVAAS